MAENTGYEGEEGGQYQDIEGAEYLQRVPYPLPLPLPRASGVYEWKQERIIGPRPIPQPVPVRAGMEQMSLQEMHAEAMATPEMQAAALYPYIFNREEVRIDVDGRYPQMTASGTLYRLLTTKVEWVANLAAAGVNTWAGAIWYKDGDVASFPYTNVRVQVTRSWFSNQRTATMTFSGGGAPNRTLTYKYRSQYFHTVQFEYDRAEDATEVTSINTCAHPNHPATLACENLTIETVFRRAGFNVQRSTGDNVVPKPLAGANGTWSDMEMHDAMQVYWSHFANKPQWSMWTFFAALHDMGTSLGGIMFDDIGPNQRQGTAIFSDSFISNAPAGDSTPAAWVQRMRFWTAVHEMGHCFNLAHSWQKSLGTPWIPLSDEPEARSFMNYPYRVTGGQSAFFSDFDYRFSDGELLFMRHAPMRFVQMGNADWFDHHAFQQAQTSPEPAFQLALRINRDKPLFEFMEPVVIELKLTNISSQAQLIREDILKARDHMTIIIKQQGKAARQFTPYVQYCWQPANKALNVGQSIYDSLFVSVGRNGWDLAEPGNYLIQIALHLENEDIVSNQLMLRVAPSKGYEEEYVAQDFFSDSVGRILSFDGSQYLNQGNDALREVVERLPTSRVACHARIALGNAMARDYKLLQMAKGGEALMSAEVAGGKINVVKTDATEARKQFGTALMDQPQIAAESLGHIDYKYYTDAYTHWLAKEGDTNAAASIQDTLYQTLSARKVLDRVLQEIKTTADGYKKKQRAA
jgi:hypothetical protein